MAFSGVVSVRGASNVLVMMSLYIAYMENRMIFTVMGDKRPFCKTILFTQGFE